MIVRCPQCRGEFRLTDFDPKERVIRYLCSNCDQIVRIDLLLDEVKTSTASTSSSAIRWPRKILVADDSAGTGEVAAQILRQEGHSVIVARDGVSALETIRDQHPDLVVLDLMLPGMTSFDLLRQIRSEPRVGKTPILVMGTIYKPDLLNVLSSLGAVGFLDKENLVDTLAFRVHQILEESETAGQHRP